MGKVVFKLFRDQNNALKAQEMLQKRGLETSLVAKKADIKDAHQILLPEIGPVYAQGSLISILQKNDPINGLKEFLGIPTETLDYYKFGLATNATLLVVHCSPEQEKEISHILRETDVTDSPPASEGFALASMMTETNPVDEKMTGDFRRY